MSRNNNQDLVRAGGPSQQNSDSEINYNSGSGNEANLYIPTPSDETRERIRLAMETTGYCDYSHVHKYEVTCEAASLKKQQSFPIKLHEILSRSDEFGDAICWLPHGRAWKIMRDDLLVENVLPNFFNHKSRASFLRQVNNWNFKRVLSGPDENAYYHEKFLRGLPHISFLMKQSQSERRKDPHKKSDHPIFARMLDLPPDFQAFTEAHPLPKACAFQPGSSLKELPSPDETTPLGVDVSDAYATSDTTLIGVRSHQGTKSKAEKRVTFPTISSSSSSQNINTETSEDQKPVAKRQKNNYSSSTTSFSANDSSGSNSDNKRSAVSFVDNNTHTNNTTVQQQQWQQMPLQQFSMQSPDNQEVLPLSAAFANQSTQALTNPTNDPINVQSFNANAAAFQGAPGGIAPLVNVDGSGNYLPSAGLVFGGYALNSNNMMQQSMFPGYGGLASQQQSQPQQQVLSPQPQLLQPAASQLQQQLLPQQQQQPQQPGSYPNYAQPIYPIDQTALGFLQRMLVNPALHGLNPHAIQPLQGWNFNNDSTNNGALLPLQGDENLNQSQGNADSYPGSSTRGTNDFPPPPPPPQPGL